MGDLYIWQCINIQGMKQDRGGHWKLGIWRGGFWGDQTNIGGEAPDIPSHLPQNPPSRFPGFQCPSLGCFIFWIHTLPPQREVSLRAPRNADSAAAGTSATAERMLSKIFKAPLNGLRRLRRCRPPPSPGLGAFGANARSFKRFSK